MIIRRVRCCALVRALVIGAALALAPGPAEAGVVVLEPSKDNSLKEDVAGAVSNGAGPMLFTGRTGSDGGDDALRAVLEFDVGGSVPPGSIVTSATLNMNLAGTTATFFAATTRVHRLLAEWGEGSSSSANGEFEASTPGDATWIHTFYDTSFWTTPGGDYVAPASASQDVLALGPYSWTSTQLIADVQAWVDTPSSNHGWIVIGEEAGGTTGRRFNSREETNTALRPKLTIVYDEIGAPTGACCLRDAAATCNEETAVDCAAAGGSYQGDLVSCGATECPAIPTAFLDPMPVPAEAVPVSGVAGGVATYDMAMREIQQQLHSELPTSTVWAYGDGSTGAVYPGPTIEATSQQTVTVNWINDLRDTSQGGNPPPYRTDHLLNVETCVHGADGTPKTVVHLHGTHTAAEFDGHPDDTILPGEQDTYIYPNDQLPSTLWYHDHALGQTRLNVYLGLAGLFVLRDATENALGLPSGPYEVPLVMQDRTLLADGTLFYPANLVESFFGETILVNGVIWPRFTVDRGKYRLRLLNGSNSRHLTLEFCPGSQVSPCPAPASFWFLGGDGGLLPAPVVLSSITLGPAERADLIFDFEPFVSPGDTEVYLVNSAPAPFPGSPGAGVVPEVMRFDVQDVAGDTNPVPATLRTLETLDEMDKVEDRDLELIRGNGDGCGDFRWQIVSLDENGNDIGDGWLDIVEYPELGTIEVWRFINRSGMSHPMHLHQKMFQVLDRQPFTVMNGDIVPTGPPQPPLPEETGWKDTVQAHPNEIVRIIKRFEGYTGLFPYHCHILEHEDQEMMRQFQTIQCGNAVLEPTEGCDDGNTTPWDGCSAACERENSLVFYGSAEGGDVQVTVDGVVVTTLTTAGMDAAAVAAVVAADIEADPTLAAMGVAAFADGSRVLTVGTIEAVVVNDPGLSVVPMTFLPGLSAPAFALLIALLTLAAVGVFRRWRDA
jgi:spore coat protein A